MAKDIKRVWDTTQKKILWGKNSSWKKWQIWKIWEELYVDNKWKWEWPLTEEIYGPVWKDLPEWDAIGYYDTNKPTSIERSSWLPNYVKVEVGDWEWYSIQFFNEDDEQWNSIDIEVDTDTEEGWYRIAVWTFGIIENEDARFLWLNMWENLDAEVVMKLFGIDEGKWWAWQFTSEAMAQFNAFINNPTEEQIAILKDWLEDKASDEYYPPHHPIVIFNEEPPFPNKLVQIEENMYFFNSDDEQNNLIWIDTDPETGAQRVNVWDFLAIEDEDTRGLWVNIWKNLDADTVKELLSMDGEFHVAWCFISEAMAQFSAFFNNPTEEQASILHDWLEEKVSTIVTFGSWWPEALLPVVTADLESLTVEDVRRIFSEPEGTPVNINGRTYYFEDIEIEYNGAVVHDASSWEFGTEISIETDDETSESQVILWYITYNPEWWKGPWEYTSTNN